jgi:hypothetical protein
LITEGNEDAGKSVIGVETMCALQRPRFPRLRFLIDEIAQTSFIRLTKISYLDAIESSNCFTCAEAEGGTSSTCAFDPDGKQLESDENMYQLARKAVKR